MPNTINFSNTTPAAPASNSNITFQVDASQNISAYAPIGLLPANNLSDVAAAATARTNLAVPGLATTNTFSLAQTFTVAPVFTAQANTRTALGLGTAAIANTAALTEATSSVLTITGGANALCAAATITVKQATTSVSGYLSSTDWNTFNGKQAALGFTPASLTTNTFSGTQTFTVAPVFTAAAASLTALGGASLTANNTFSGTQTFGAGQVTIGAGGLNLAGQSVSGVATFTGASATFAGTLGVTGAATFSAATVVSRGLKSGSVNAALLLQTTDVNYMGLGFSQNTNANWTIQSFEQGIGYRALSLNPSGGNVLIGTTTDRQQLSVGSYLDIYSGGVNSPTVPSIRASSGNNLILSAFSSGSVFLNYDGGTGGVGFCGGTNSVVASVSATGIGAFAGLSVTGVVTGSKNLNLGTSGVADGAILMTASGNGATAGAPLAWNMVVGGGFSNSTIAQIKPLAFQGGQNWLQFFVGGWNNNAAVGSALMTLSSNGNLLLGSTTDNGSQLQVAGNTAIGGTLGVTGAITGTLGGWTTWLNTNGTTIASGGVTQGITCSGSMTAGGISVYDAQYLRIGPLVYIKVLVTLTLGTAASNMIYVAPPVAPVGNNSFLTGNINTNGVSQWTAAVSDLSVANSRLEIWPTGEGNYTISQQIQITISGFYRCA